MWDALKSIARVGRAVPIDIYGKIFFIRYQPQSVYKAVFLPANIKKNTFRINYSFPEKNSTDSIIVEFFDEETWQYNEVECFFDTKQNPEKMRFFGISNREHAWREGMHILACKKYQNQKIVFETELEGHIPQFGDLVAVSHDLYTWSSTGEILVFSGNNIETSEPLLWQDGEIHIIGFKSSTGNLIGPYICVRGDSDNHAVLTDSIEFVPSTSINNRTCYVFGIQNGKFVKDCLVTAVIPRKQSVEVHLVNDNQLIHTADQGTAPPINEEFIIDSGPVISDLEISDLDNQYNYNGTFDVTITLTWNGNAESYVVQRRMDEILLEEVSISNQVYVYQETVPLVQNAPVQITYNNFRVAGITNNKMGIWSKISLYEMT